MFRLETNLVMLMIYVEVFYQNFVIFIAPSKNACERLKSWGEEKKRIYFTGAPQLDDFKNLEVNDNENYIIIFHPVLNEHKILKKQIHSLISAINHTNISATWIYPNNDLGYQVILKELKHIKNKKIKLVSNLRDLIF